MDTEKMNSVKQAVDCPETTEYKTSQRKHGSIFSAVVLLLFVFALGGAGYMHLARRLAYVESQLAVQCACPGQSVRETDGLGHDDNEKFEPSWEQQVDNNQVGREKRSGIKDSPLFKNWEVRLFHPKTANGRRHKRHHDMAKGVVEVKVDGRWGRICDRNWGLAEANVVCRHLGHDGAIRSYRKAAANFGQYFSSHFSMSDVECTGNEQSFGECNHVFNTVLCEQKSHYKMSAGVKCAITDHCATSPCENGGTCNNGQKDYTCDCRVGWEGRNCERETDQCSGSPCQNNATCQGGPHGYTCLCAPGWEGHTCDINTDDCEDDPCQHNGTCVDGVNTYRCLCAPGWEGTHCDIHQCASGPCQNNGTCHATTQGYKCACAPGWQGHHCETMENMCDSDPCQNNGTCHHGGDHYICQCEHAWGGVHCETHQTASTVVESTTDESPHGYLGMDSKSSTTWIHIAARSDSDHHKLTIKLHHGVLADHWETVRSNKFHLDHGKLEVQEDGDYYIYSQVQYLENHKNTFTTNHTVMVTTKHQGSDQFLTCVHEMYGYPPHKTCFTAGMRKLYRKDVVYLYVPCDGCVISLDHDTTFFGLIKIN